jgi:predicted chitinase
MRASEFIVENFADGKKPGRKGLAKRSGVNTKASVSDLRKTAKNSTGEKARMAHWMANMKAGRAKHEDIEEGWKDWVAGAAMGAASLGAAGDADAAVKHKDLSKPAIHQSVKKKEVKPVAPPTASKKELAKSVTGNSHEVFLKKAAKKAGIEGQELIAFLSQCAHETLDFKHMKEIGGSLDFRKYDPKYAPKKAKALGNNKPGDGAKYKGRGYIQLTGKYNYKKAGEALGLPLEQKPELLEKPEIAAKAAVWYWKNRVATKVDNFKDTTGVTKTINPGMKHLDQRKDKQKAFQIAMR